MSSLSTFTPSSTCSTNKALKLDDIFTTCDAIVKASFPSCSAVAQASGCTVDCKSIRKTFNLPIDPCGPVLMVTTVAYNASVKFENPISPICGKACTTPFNPDRLYAVLTTPPYHNQDWWYVSCDCHSQGAFLPNRTVLAEEMPKGYELTSYETEFERARKVVGVVTTTTMTTTTAAGKTGAAGRGVAVKWGGVVMVMAGFVVKLMLV
ncbi:hypothetical protein BC829DRAFT_423171 [Chytridium lagenaria]|nr:hypothetical protein BC829DRAFT_423171 [Chytridium lagenaria]